MRQMLKLTFIIIGSLFLMVGLAASAPGGSHETVSPCPLVDGRLNAADCGAPLAVYCTAAGVTVWDINPDGHGAFAFSSSPVEIGTALARGSSGFLGEGLGNRLSITPTGQIVAVGPEIFESQKTYAFGFDGGACGVSIVASGGDFTVEGVEAEVAAILAEEEAAAEEIIVLDGSTAASVELNSAPPRPDDAPAVANARLGFGFVNTDNMNLRSGPGRRYTVVAVADGGTRVDVLGRNEPGPELWWYIQAGDIRGWANFNNILYRGRLPELEVIPNQGELIQPFVTIGIDEYFVRATPDPFDVAVCQLPRRLDHRVVGRTFDETWWQIEANCNDGVVRVGWAQAEVSILRNFGGVDIPVTGGID